MDGWFLGEAAKLIQSVYLVNEGGETIASVPIGEFQLDEALFGGFLSAIQMYSKKISGKNVSELSLESYRIIISKADRVFLVTIHDLGDKNAAELNNKISDLCKGTLGEVVTDETIKLIKAAASEAQSAMKRANEWASKML
ncbi:MAG: hypothetical protein EAX87_12205 [Candidatus Thorarchaeota archaeon]|nr:hypothetical protein [Candidatus Thorarchaeota archaeon]